jgi:hypothetical protein
LCVRNVALSMCWLRISFSVCGAIYALVYPIVMGHIPGVFLQIV